MSPQIRTTWSVIACAVSLGFWGLIFSAWSPKTDLKAYGVSSIALIFAVLASAIAYPLRVDTKGKLLCAVCMTIAVLWSLELFGGLAWYGADKVARHYQKK